MNYQSTRNHRLQASSAAAVLEDQGTLTAADRYLGEIYPDFASGFSLSEKFDYNN